MRVLHMKVLPMKIPPITSTQRHKKHLLRCTKLLVLLFTGVCHTAWSGDWSDQRWQLFLQAGPAWAESINNDNSTRGSDDAEFQTGRQGETGLRFRLAGPLFVEGSYGLLQKLATEPESDSSGEFQLHFDGTETRLGLMVRLWRFDPSYLWLRGGLLRYELEVTLEESFYNFKPAGEVTEETSGSGHYLGLGYSHCLGHHLAFSLAGEYHQRSDLFEDSSSPFDLNTYSINLGLLVSF